MHPVALITGATRNTGYAVAEKFASEGYDVVLTSRDRESARLAAERLSAAHPSVRVLGVAMQVDQVPSIREAFAQARAAFGRLDAFVANAAHLGVGLSVFTTTQADWDAVMNVNARGIFFGCQEAVRIMAENGGGAICLISSVHAHAAVPERVAYAASKGAINAMARAVAVEVGHLNIRVNALVAGAIWSERWAGQPAEVTAARRAQYPLGRESRPEEIANGVYYLCSSLSPTVTGTELTIDSGIEACLLPYDKEWNRHEPDAGSLDARAADHHSPGR